MYGIYPSILLKATNFSQEIMVVKNSISEIETQMQYIHHYLYTLDCDNERKLLLEYAKQIKEKVISTFNSYRISGETTSRT